MLGMFHLLPLLKGWEYKLHKLNRTLNRGADAIEVPVAERGFLMLVTIITDDCKATMQIDYQGADLQQHSITANAEAAQLLSAYAPDPSGFIQRYTRNNPNTTDGIFVLVGFSGGMHGATFPYVPTVKMSAFLPNDSTQEKALINFAAQVIVITDLKLFIQSLRAVSVAHPDPEINEMLLTLGPEELQEK